MQAFVSKTNRPGKYILVYIVFLLLSLFLFWPVLNKNFASDDFSVLYRDVYHHGFFIKEFFRPLSDLTLYCSYLMGGFNPLFYNLFNVILHAGCCFMLYFFCLMNNGLHVKSPSVLAWFASLLFLIYPFHNESVIWVLGRASMTSCFFGFLSLIAAFSGAPSFKKYYLSCLLYFIGLCGYETILPLPAIILLLLYRKHTPLKEYVPVAFLYAFTLLINIVVRYLVSSVVYGSYGARMFEPAIRSYVLKFFKVTGRLFLPPGNQPVLMGICFAVLILFIAVLSVLIAKRRNQQSFSYIKLSIVVLLSAAVPLMFGLSTRTYEGDRVFYFTSFFFCIWLANLADVFSHYKISRFIMVLLPAYFLFFFYQGLFAWRKAGAITTNIINTVKQIRKEDGKLLLINLPEEYNGAQVLRTGLMEALLINQIDTSGITVVNHLTTEFAVKIPGLIKPVQLQPDLYIAPAALVGRDVVRAKIWAASNDSTYMKYGKHDRIYYWNKESLVLLNNLDQQR